MKNYLHGLLLLSLLLCFSFLLSPVAFAQKEAEGEGSPKNLVIELLETTYRYQNDGTGEITQAVRIRVLTQAGRDAIGQIYFTYSSQLEDLRIGYFRTLKKDGTVADVDPAKAMDVTPNPTQIAPTFSDLRAKAMVASKLEVGDALEYQFERIIRVPLKPGDFWAIYYPERSAPVESERTILDVPQGRPLSFKSSANARYTSEDKNGRTIYRWELKNTKPDEAGDPSGDPLFVASTIKDWKDVGEWYTGLQTGRTEVTPEIRTLAAKLTEGKTTPREKLEAIYDYVVTSVRYVALEFGAGGYQAHSAAEVLRNGYGDCKDKAGLISALLDSVGLKAYPALVNSKRGVVEPLVPAPGQFDHVIVAVPLDGRLLWLDQTFELAPLGLLTRALQGKQALLVQPGNPRLEGIPEESPVPDWLKLTLSGKLDAAGKIKLDCRIEMRGSTEVVYRRLFRSENQQAIKAATNVLSTMLVYGATLENPESSDPTELQPPFRVHYKLTLSSYFDPFQKSLETVVPHVLISEDAWKDELSKQEVSRNEASREKAGGKNENKKKDLNLGEEARVEEILDLELDPVYQAELPLPVHVDRPFGSYSSTYSFEENHVRAKRALQVTARKLPADRWQELATYQKLVDGDLNQKIVLRRTGSFDLRSQLQNLTADELNHAGATALDERRDFALARDLLLKATERDPKHKWAWNNLGRAYLGLGMIDEAEHSYKKQIEVNPDDEYAHNNLGRVYAARNQYDKAIAEFKKQLEINPLDPYGYPNLADAYGRLGQWNDAAEAWKKAITIEREKPEFYVSLAHALIKAGKPEGAREPLHRALEKDHSAMMLNNVAYELADAGLDLAAAERDAATAVSQTARSIENPTLASATPEMNAQLGALGAYLDTLGWIYFRQGRMAESEPYLEAAYELNHRAEIAEHLALLRAQVDDPDSALRLYSCSRIGKGSTEPNKELLVYLKKKYGSEGEIESRTKQQSQTCFDLYRVTPRDGRSFARPPSGEAKTGAVRIAVLVNEQGSVDEAEVVSGNEPFRDTALAEARQLHFRPITWPGRSLKTVRTVTFSFSSREKVSALWSFGKFSAQLPPAFQQFGGVADASSPSQTGETENLDAYSAHIRTATAFRVRRNLEQAIAEYRTAVKMNPEAVTAHRGLADTLSDAGDKEAAAKEYVEVTRLDPNDAEIHFRLGTYFELHDTKGVAGFRYDSKAKRLVAPKGWKPSSELKKAFEEYKKAHDLAPENAIYKAAYERLAERMNQVR